MGFLDVVSYASALVVLYYLALFCVSLWTTRRTPGDPRAVPPFYVLVVPAHDEALVIGETVRRARALDYDRYLVVVLDDGSSDGTGAAAAAAAQDDPRVIVLTRPPEVAGQGKGEVLNHAFGFVRDLLATPVIAAGLRESEVVLCVVDADGWLEPHALRAVAPYFADPRVAGVQLPVRMFNARDGLLALMQDMEFIGFSLFVQAGRDPFNSVGLGGNGQFVRVSALASLGERPWSRCLTEDLDLSLSLVARGWRNRFCPRAFVAQQGLSSWRPLLRQRTRWIQGHYSCWQHLPGLWRNRSVPLATRIDLSLYLVLVGGVLVLALQAALGVGERLGLALPETRFLAFVGSERLYRALTLGFAVAPMLGFAITYQRYAVRRLPLLLLPGLLLAFALYNYAWTVVASLRALTRIALRRGAWVKTPRQPVTDRILADEASALEVAAA